MTALLQMPMAISEFPLNNCPPTLYLHPLVLKRQEVNVTNNTLLQIQFVPVSTLGQDIVVSASRTAERILESPVTVERISTAAIRNAPASSYYDIVQNIKGVDLTASSLTFKTPSTRGFNGSGNLRFNQRMDGMDNQAPGLNFSVGMVVGLSELDVESMELLPGASSALYGPGGMNGTLLINSKNPFKYQGLSLQVKQGVMHVDENTGMLRLFTTGTCGGLKPLVTNLRSRLHPNLLKRKTGWQPITAIIKDRPSVATIIPGTRETDPNYDGVNMYGDETTADIRRFSRVLPHRHHSWHLILILFPVHPLMYRVQVMLEKDVVDPETMNFKLGGALHYKITPTLEAIVMGYWGTGNTVYTGSDRYSLEKPKNGPVQIGIEQHQLVCTGLYNTGKCR